MDTQDKIELKGIFDRTDGEMSYYDAGLLLQYVGKMFQGYEKAAYQSINYAKEDAESLVTFAKQLINKMEAYQIELDAAVEKFNQDAENAYIAADKKRRELVNKFGSLSRLSVDEVRIPYGLKELLDVCEKLSRFDDKTVEIAVKLATAMGATK